MLIVIVIIIVIVMWKKEDKSRVEKVLIKSRSSMFGDTFGQHADYSSGLFYSGRREFLHTEDGVNVLQPPQDFKNKKQMKHELKIQKAGGVNLQRLEFASAQVGDNATTKKIKGDPNQKKKKVSKIVYVEKFSSTNPDDWNEEFQAGCRIWVNNSTGEVTTECPWLPSSSSSILPLTSRKEDGDGGETETYATGHLVYNNDSDGIGEILDYLDTIIAKKK